MFIITSLYKENIKKIKEAPNRIHNALIFLLYTEKR